MLSFGQNPRPGMLNLNIPHPRPGKDPANLMLSDPSIMPDLIALPVRRKGLGMRRVDDFVGVAASIGGWDMVSRNPIDRTDEEGNRYEGSTRSSSLLSAQIPKTRKTRIPASRPSPMAAHRLAHSSEKHSTC